MFSPRTTDQNKHTDTVPLPGASFRPLRGGLRIPDLSRKHPPFSYTITAEALSVDEDSTAAHVKRR